MFIFPPTCQDTRKNMIKVPIKCNVICFINNAAKPLGNRGVWRMAMWYLIIQGKWEIKSAESTQYPPLSFLPVITSSYFFSFLFFPLAWQLLKVYLLIYSVSAPCLHVSRSDTTHDQRTEMRKTRFYPLFYFFLIRIH